jgi:hypothetical protein
MVSRLPSFPIWLAIRFELEAALRPARRQAFEEGDVVCKPRARERKPLFRSPIALQLRHKHRAGSCTLRSADRCCDNWVHLNLRVLPSPRRGAGRITEVSHGDPHSVPLISHCGLIPTLRCC